MNDLFRRFNSEIPDANKLTLEELENKAAELRGQLNATVENPQLMKRLILFDFLFFFVFIFIFSNYFLTIF